MTGESQPWASRFRPCTLNEVAGNERAVRQLKNWVLSWRNKTPEYRAAFLYGPPGVGKTASVVALAKDMDYDLLEVNASDYRTRKRLEELVGRAAQQTVTITGKRRMILFDELEGTSGRKDRGGIAAIADIIKGTRIPIVLVATSMGESWEDKFRPLADLSTHIEFGPVPFGEVIRRLRACAEELDIVLDEEVLELLADRCEGDLRSALNDLEAIARGRKRVAISDCGSLGFRDRKDYTPDALMKMFSAKTLRDARRIISSAHIDYDTLFDWIHENLPTVLDDPQDLADAMDYLAKADIHQTRGRRTQEYRLLKYMFNDMTGGVALSRRGSDGTGIIKLARKKIAELGFPPSNFVINEAPEGVDIRPVRRLGDDWRRVNFNLRGIGANWVRGGGRWSLPYFRPPQVVWRYRRTWHSRRRRRGVAEKVARRCHISTREAVAKVIPLMKVIYRGDTHMAEGLTSWLELDDKEAKWLAT